MKIVTRLTLMSRKGEIVGGVMNGEIRRGGGGFEGGGGEVSRCDAHCCSSETGVFYNLWQPGVTRSSLKRDYLN